MCMTEPARRGLRRGFSLIELIIFIVLVSVGVAGILKVMDLSVAASADPMLRKQAIALADSVLEEILLKAYADPDGSNAGETDRFSFDDVDDFNGKTQADFAPLPAGLSSYAISVVVSASTLGTQPAKQVSVTVRAGATEVTMTGYRSAY